MNTSETSVAEAASRSVTFARPFMLPGMDEPHQPGTFELRQSHEPLDVMHDAYRTVQRLVLIHGGITEVFEVTADELEFALALDEASVRG